MFKFLCLSKMRGMFNCREVVTKDTWGAFLQDFAMKSKSALILGDALFQTHQARMLFDSLLC